MGVINRKFPTPPPEPVRIPDRNGLIRQDDNVCVCGHWGVVHRNGGTATCEGRRCGCYTFRPLTRDVKQPGQVPGPKCPVCGDLLLGKLLRLVSPVTFRTLYGHLVGDSVCTVEEMLPEVAEVEKDIERQRAAWDDSIEPWWEATPPEWGEGEPLLKPRLIKPKPEPVTGRARIALGEEV